MPIMPLHTRDTLPTVSAVYARQGLLICSNRLIAVIEPSMVIVALSQLTVYTIGGMQWNRGDEKHLLNDV